MTAALLRRARGGKRKTKARTPKSDYDGYETLSKQLDELECPSGFRLIMDNKTDLQNLKLRVKLDTGYWKDGDYTFTIQIPDNYPTDTPIVKCQEKLEHPLINGDGQISLRFLKDKWMKDYGLQTIVNSISDIFKAPHRFIFDKKLVIAYIRWDNDQTLSVPSDVYDVIERYLVERTNAIVNVNDNAIYSAFRNIVDNFQLT